MANILGIDPHISPGASLTNPGHQSFKNVSSMVTNISFNSCAPFLVDANDLFLIDLTYVSQHRKGKYKFDAIESVENLQELLELGFGNIIKQLQTNTWEIS